MDSFGASLWLELEHEEEGEQVFEKRLSTFTKSGVLKERNPNISSNQSAFFSPACKAQETAAKGPSLSPAMAELRSTLKDLDIDISLCDVPNEVLIANCISWRKDMYTFFRNVKEIGQRFQERDVSVELLIGSGWISRVCQYVCSAGSVLLKSTDEEQHLERCLDLVLCLLAEMAASPGVVSIIANKECCQTLSKLSLLQLSESTIVASCCRLLQMAASNDENCEMLADIGAPAVLFAGLSPNTSLKRIVLYGKERLTLLTLLSGMMLCRVSHLQDDGSPSV